MTPLIANIVKNNDFKTQLIFENLTLAHRYLGELKGLCQSLPNPAILINTLSIQKAQDSSNIENIITTDDEVLKQRMQPSIQNPAAKEVNNYSKALYYCNQQLRKHNLLTLNTMIDAQKIIKGNDAGIRIQSGVILHN